MRPPMTRLTQANQVVQPVRIGTNTPSEVMHVRHVRRAAELAHTITTLMHLHPTLRVNRVTLTSPVTDLLHSSSSRTACSNASSSNAASRSASRFDTGIPPARSNARIIGSASLDTFTFAGMLHT